MTQVGAAAALRRYQAQFLPVPFAGTRVARLAPVAA